MSDADAKRKPNLVVIVDFHSEDSLDVGAAQALIAFDHGNHGQLLTLFGNLDRVARWCEGELQRQFQDEWPSAETPLT